MVEEIVTSRQFLHKRVAPDPDNILTQ
jgi:hypothetical protein